MALLEIRVDGPGEVHETLDRRSLSLTLVKTGTAEDDTVALVVRHAIAQPEHVFVPHLTPTAANVVGDAVFRAPAIVLADRETALALIVDLDDVRAAEGFRAWLDYDHPRRAVTLAIGAYRETGHVFYEREPLRFVGTATLRMHVLMSHEARDCANPYGMAARWIWERWGRRGIASASSLAPYLEHTIRWAFSENEGWGESVWQRVDAKRAAPVFIVDVSRHPSVPRSERRWREPRSIWNQAWFSTQRCANGLLRHGRHIGSLDLETRAREMTALALSAPQSDGLFPSVLLATEDGGWRWTNSDRRPRTTSGNACHLVDAAFTSRMLLDWHELTRDSEARAYVTRFAERLVRLQRPSGAFPGWIEPDGRVPNELAEGPESAVAVSLLFELGPSWHTVALGALPFLEEVVRDARWEDFETYYSCAPWGQDDQVGKRVARNGVYKQNTLSIAWCAEAFLLAWRATQQSRFLDLARRCVDELALYQAVWDPPWLPAPSHGGFGVMNADCEWNDARQSLFAPLFLELGRAMSDRELVERGVSALRAAFRMMYCPENEVLAKAYERRHPVFGPESYGFMMENQGHMSADPIGTFTIFTWGPGSALATAALVRERFPEHAHACGLR